MNKRLKKLKNNKEHQDNPCREIESIKNFIKREYIRNTELQIKLEQSTKVRLKK